MFATSRVELLIYGFIRCIERDHKLHRKMERDVKTICIEYFKSAFNSSNIIDVLQGMELQELLADRISFDQAILLYNSSINKTDVQSFYLKTISHHPTVVIIKSNHGNIFGGYTRVAWTKDNEHHKDEDACLFALQSDQQDQNSEIFDICQSLHAIHFNGTFNKQILCHFGSPAGLCLYQNFDQHNNNFCFGGDSCSYWFPKGNILCGGNDQDSMHKEKYKFKVVSLEVFELRSS